MILSLDVERLRNPEQVRAFLDGNEPVDFQPVSRSEAYAFVSRMLSRFDYTRLGKSDRGLVKAFVGKATGLSRSQVTRLVGQFVKTGQVVDRRRGATRQVMRREFEVYGDIRYVRLARISNGHLYNLRRSTTYRRRRTVLDRTRPTRVAIGERRPPRADGRPGFVRVERLRSLDDAERFLKPGITFAALDETASPISDLSAMREVNRARDELFRAIGSALGGAKAA